MRGTSNAERADMMAEEIERLKKQLAVLDRQWSQKHYLALFGLLAIPAFFVGVMYGVIVLLCTPALVLTQAYLVGIRRAECRELIAEARRELARVRPAKPEGTEAQGPKSTEGPKAQSTEAPAAEAEAR